MKLKERYSKVLHYFQSNQPVAETELKYGDPYQLLVAVILSAQCTDKRVNIITPKFFELFPSVQSLSGANFDEVFPLIKSCSYPNNKAKHLIGMANYVCSEFSGKIPAEIEKLQKIPGVGRKTANVIAAVIFGKPAMAVDTHVFRVSARLGLTIGAKNPYEAEMQLVKHIPEKLIPIAHHWLILHGRYTCMARKPDCSACGLKAYCKFYEQLENAKKTKIVLLKSGNL
jgi:endonuclease III